VAFGAWPELSVGVGVFSPAGLVDEVGGAVRGEGVEEALPIGEFEFDKAGRTVSEEGDGMRVVFGAGKGVVGCGGVGCGDPVAAGAVAGVSFGENEFLMKGCFALVVRVFEGGSLVYCDS